MKNSDYWKQRFTQLEEAQNGMGADAYAEIERQYRKAQKELEGQISAWYQRFANNNGITMQEARSWLTGKDLKEFKWSVQEYIQHGEESALTGQWVKELENASAKFHISKLEALKIHTEESLQQMFAKQNGTLTDTLGSVFQSGYYHTAYELQHGFGIGFDIAVVDQSYLEKVLSKPWAVDGYNFSERIWNNKEKLISEIHTELSRNIMTGGDPQKAIDAIAKKMNTSKNNAGRLVMTEEAYFSSAAQQECFADLGVEEYEIVATLDSHTSDICQSLDGQHFPMKDYEPGVTAPPFHVNCRSTTAPYFDENFGQIGSRAARDEETGKIYYVPEDMKYQDWKTAFVDGDKSGFDAGTQMGGSTVYSHQKQAEPEKVKKEYLTENKLKAKIADADVQIEELEKQADSVLAAGTGGTYEDVKQAGGVDKYYADVPELDKFYSTQDEMASLEDKYGGWSELTDHGSDEDIIKYDQLEDAHIQAEAELQKKGYKVDAFGKVEGVTPEEVKAWAAEKAQIEALEAQMKQVEAQKAEWETKLAEKVAKKQKKALVKEQMQLEAQKTALEQKLAAIDVKTYSGIWKGDVTTADYASLNIQGKKNYFTAQIQSGTLDQAKLQQFQEYLKQLDELETEGKSYAEVEAELKKIEKELNKVQADLKTLDNGGIMDAVDDAFTQARKDAAVWAKSTKEADKVLRDKCGEVWRTAPKVQRDSIYEYTSSYSKFNEPLRGIEYGTNAVKGVGNVDLDQIGVGGYGHFRRGEVRKQINAMTDIIEQSTYDFDIWLQRGCDFRGMDSFFEISMSDLRNASQADLEQLLLGKTVTDYGFFSCGVSKGKGFASKPIIMNVYAPKGTKMMYAEPFSAFGNGAGHSWDGITPQSSFGNESEIILQQGTSFRITKVERNNGKLYVDIEVILQNIPQR